MGLRPGCKCLESVCVRDMREVLCNFSGSPGGAIRTAHRSDRLFDILEVSCGTVTLTIGGQRPDRQLDVSICSIFSFQPRNLTTTPCTLPNCNNCNCLEDPCLRSLRDKLNFYRGNGQVINIKSIGTITVDSVKVVEVRDGIVVVKDALNPNQQNEYVSLCLIESLEIPLPPV